VAPARGKAKQPIAFAGAKFNRGRGSSVGNSTEAKLRAAKLLAGEVGAVRGRAKAVRGYRSASGEKSTVLKKEQGTRRGWRAGGCP
jgi:hypothetical protein